MDERAALIDEIREHHIARRALMERALTLCGVEDTERFLAKGVPQSQLFMLEIIPFLHKIYLSEPENTTKSILDVGPQTFSGSALLRDLHTRASFNRLKLNVTAIDIVDRFDLLREMLAPGLEFIRQDIFELEGRTWDTVICSHVIEHIADPIPFLRRLQQMANDHVIVACPWREDPIVTKSHVTTIDKDLIVQAGGKDLEIFTNYCWGKMREVCIFRLDGAAT